jgi:hypothetical protein
VASSATNEAASKALILDAVGLNTSEANGPT